MAVLDAAVGALQLHLPAIFPTDTGQHRCHPTCGWSGTSAEAAWRHVAATVLGAGFRTANPDDLRNLDGGESGA